uniref:Uncharacterized protein n=1 Tax=Avena sativa TaxID=4498 RepID=A0ACD5UU53_AVESA
MGGVLELGTADQVLEDTNMVNQISTSFWEIRFPTCSESEEPSSSPSENETGEVDIVFKDLDHVAAYGLISGEIECMSDGNLERITKEIDDFYGLCEELDVRALEDNWIMDGSFGIMPSPEAAPQVPDADKMANDVVTLISSVESSLSSCFREWKRTSDLPRDVSAASAAWEPQKLLKKAVAGGAWTNDGRRAQESNVKGHVMSERRRRGKLNEMFLILKSLVPSIHKVDKASILAETIAYLKEMEQRVEELESSRGRLRGRSPKSQARGAMMSLERRSRLDPRGRRQSSAMPTPRESTSPSPRTTGRATWSTSP